MGAGQAPDDVLLAKALVAADAKVLLITSRFLHWPYLVPRRVVQSVVRLAANGLPQRGPWQQRSGTAPREMKARAPHFHTITRCPTAPQRVPRRQS